MNLVRDFMVFGLEGFPMIREGDDLARIIVETSRANGVGVEDLDVVVVAQKVFSKAEGRIVSLKDVVPSRRAKSLAEKVGKSPRFVELVLRETKRVLKASRSVLLVEDVRGLVCINAGIDKSNVEGKEKFALLPLHPDESAEKCRLGIRRLTAKNVAVVMVDTYSRPFRRGQTNFAIGIAGINPFRDYRGKMDLYSQVLKVKNVAVVDEIASAGELLMGQATEARPVVVFRGLANSVLFCRKCRCEEMFISRREDLFRNVL